MSENIKNIVSDIGSRLSFGQDPMPAIIHSGLTADRIEEEIRQQGYPSVFGILTNRNVDVPLELINSLVEYGFEIKEQSFLDALSERKIGLAHKYILAGFIPKKINSTSNSIVSDIHFLPWIFPEHFKTADCNLHAMGAVLDSILATGFNINHCCFGTDNVLSCAMSNVCEYTLNNDPEECLSFLELYIVRGADYLITNKEGGASCLVKIVASPSEYKLVFRILDLLESKHNIVPQPDDIDNPVIEAYLNHKLSSEASRCIANTTTHIPKRIRL